MDGSDYYDQISASYAELHRTEQFRKLSIIRQNLALPENARILDIGCGPCWSADFFPDVTGIDPSFALLSSGHTGAGNARAVIQASAERLPFKGRSFDAILCLTALHHFELRQAVSEIRRVAKPACVLALTILKKSDKHDTIRSALLSSFALVNEIEEEKDVILFLR